MKPLLCLLGIHDWVIILPGQKPVTYRGKQWWPMSGARSQVCRRCGKLLPGQVLIPAEITDDEIVVMVE